MRTTYREFIGKYCGGGNAVISYDISFRGHINIPIISTDKYYKALLVYDTFLQTWVVEVETPLTAFKLK